MKKLFFLLLLTSSLCASAPHITFLMQSGRVDRAIDLYFEHKKELEQHDFSLLEKMATTLLESAARASDPEEQLVSFYSASMAGLSTSVDILASGVTSQHPVIQLAAIQLLGKLQDDRCDELLGLAMSSNYLPVRMEAGYLLSARKSRSSTGHMEALMQRVPPQFRSYFPEFFALIGTEQATNLLRRFVSDSDLSVRIESILCAARYQRDDLLPTIRRHSSHLGAAEQEVCAYALGALRDNASLEKLKSLATSNNSYVRLAACRSLYQLGDTSYAAEIARLAESGDLYALSLLSEVEGQEETLVKALSSDDLHAQLGATVSLLKKRDVRCIPSLLNFLLRDMRDVGIYPMRSPGHSLSIWKAQPSLEQIQKRMPMVDLRSLTISVKESLITQALELPEKEFLSFASAILQSGQKELIPQVMAMLENLESEAAINLLKAQAERPGAPFIRNYANLMLLRMKVPGPYQQRVVNFVKERKGQDVISFRPPLIRTPDMPYSSFELTAEEETRLLLSAYLTLASTQDEKAIDMLLELMKEGSRINQCAIAGMLLCALQ